jgi:hypothetical protein
MLELKGIRDTDSPRYLEDFPKFEIAETFLRAGRDGISRKEGIKAEDVEKFNRIVFGPDEDGVVLEAAAEPSIDINESSTQADRIISTLRLLKNIPDL